MGNSQIGGHQVFYINEGAGYYKIPFALEPYISMTLVTIAIAVIGISGLVGGNNSSLGISLMGFFGGIYVIMGAVSGAWGDW